MKAVKRTAPTHLFLERQRVRNPGVLDLAACGRVLLGLLALLAVVLGHLNTNQDIVHRISQWAGWMIGRSVRSMVGWLLGWLVGRNVDVKYIRGQEPGDMFVKGKRAPVKGVGPSVPHENLLVLGNSIQSSLASVKAN